MAETNFEGVPYEVALYVKRFYENELIENNNIGHITISPYLDAFGDETGQYVIEIGLYDLARQEVIDPALIQMNGNKENLAFFSLDQTVPDFLEIPDDLVVNQAHISSTQQIDDQKVQKFLVAFKDRPIRGVKVEKVQAKNFYGLSFHNEQDDMQAGISVNHFARNQYGTLGSVIKLDSIDGNYIISNWHVLSNKAAKINDTILHPGPKDRGRKPQNNVGTLVWYRLGSYSDVAIAKLNNGVNHIAQSKCDYSIKGSTTPVNGMSVLKCARTTERQQGTIKKLHHSAWVIHREYPGGRLYFKDQILIDIKNRPGDSGSVIVEADSKKSVGLVFAGDKEQQCLANYLDYENLINTPLFEKKHDSIENIKILFN